MVGADSDGTATANALTLHEGVVLAGGHRQRFDAANKAVAVITVKLFLSRATAAVHFTKIANTPIIFRPSQTASRGRETFFMTR
ncbi:hypothetical protein [Haloplanus litoreus]|uniref:Uncharacterized protein n=1 Tax=Haloplanus litoreus TaxID=767515 RepID=A0ABD5ZYR0_9EURY